MRDAMRAGLHHVRDTHAVRCVLVRTGAFSVAASSLLALLPILAAPHGARGYGLLMASFGAGALAGAAVLPRLRRKLSTDALVSAATLVYAGMTFATGRIESFTGLGFVLFAAGMAWIAILASLNVAAQTMSPSGLRARSLSMYILVLQGGMALGSAAWGAVATRYGIPASLFFSAIALLLGILAVRHYRLPEDFSMAPVVVRD
jgi:predicted MFS family arabinose efflux permease